MSRRKAIQDRTAHKIYQGVALLDGVTIRGEKYIKRDDALDQCDRFISATNPAPVTATREQASQATNHDAGSEATSKSRYVFEGDAIYDRRDDRYLDLATATHRLNGQATPNPRSQRIEEAAKALDVAARNFRAAATSAIKCGEPWTGSMQTLSDQVTEKANALAAELQQEQA